MVFKDKSSQAAVILKIAKNITRAVQVLMDHRADLVLLRKPVKTESPPFSGYVLFCSNDEITEKVRKSTGWRGGRMMPWLYRFPIGNHLGEQEILTILQSVFPFLAVR